MYESSNVFLNWRPETWKRLEIYMYESRRGRGEFRTLSALRQTGLRNDLEIYTSSLSAVAKSDHCAWKRDPFDSSPRLSLSLSLSNL